MATFFFRSDEDEPNVTASVKEVRDWIDGKFATLDEDIDHALDWAQGVVVSGEKDEAYIVIRVTK